MKPGEFIRVMAAMQWLGGRPACRDYLAMRLTQLRRERAVRAALADVDERATTRRAA